ncbi:NAD(P)-dependent oxidoreductase [bacterium]|nr:NAD(P)-dependent oxidoreductase [bacterium]
MSNIVIAGGAGFVGSHIAEFFINKGSKVTVIDGLLNETGGSIENLAHLPQIDLIGTSVEEFRGLGSCLSKADLLIDCMGWTRHLLALENPTYDLKLNIESHLTLIEALKGSACKKVIHLGSRGQYGQLSVENADESEPQTPADVQGIHKSAAEAHWRLAARRLEIDVASLIFGNTFGPRQPMIGRDIGLVASFTRTLLEGEEVEIYGKGRMRDLVFCPDLASVVGLLSESDWKGFQAYNILGQHVTLEELVKTLQKVIGRGTYSFQDFPEEVRQIDMGSSTLNDEKFRREIGCYPATDLETSIRKTIQSIINKNE